MTYQRVAFICGPYRAGRLTVLENIRNAEAVAIAVWRRGYVALCPHKNTAHFDGILPNDEAWLAGDMTMLARCDCLVTVPGWEVSEGAPAEVDSARGVGMPVYHDPADLP